MHTQDLKAYFLQQGNTHSNKVIPPNSATPFGDHFFSNYHKCSMIAHAIAPALEKEKQEDQEFKDFAT